MSALTPRDAAAAVAMCLLRTEGEAKVTSMAFSTTFEVCAKDRGERSQVAKPRAHSCRLPAAECAPGAGLGAGVAASGWQRTSLQTSAQRTVFPRHNSFLPLIGSLFATCSR